MIAMAYRKVLVGVDGSDTAFKALDYAARFAAAQKAELLILAVGDASGERRDLDSVLEKGRAMAAEAGVDAGVKRVSGDPADKIVEVAQESDTDVVVLGNRGMKGVKRMLGSVPNKVSHHVGCDLLIVKTT